MSENLGGIFWLTLYIARHEYDTKLHLRCHREFDEALQPVF